MAQLQEQKCPKCNNRNTNPKSIACSACYTRYHYSCLAFDAAEIPTLGKPGVRWYCEGCVVKLADYHHLPTLSQDVADIKVNIENIEKKLDQTPTTSYAEILAQGTAVTAIAERMEKKIDKDLRKNNAIIHGYKEAEKDMLDLKETIESMSIHSASISDTTRLGVKNDNKPRPIRLTFRTENQKWDFLKRWNSGSQKPEGTYAKLDLSKEDQNAEYQLRAKRRELATKNPEKAYKIKNGAILEQIDSQWSPVI